MLVESLSFCKAILFFLMFVLFFLVLVFLNRGKQKISTFSDFNGQQRKKVKIKQNLEFNIDYVNFFNSASNIDLFY